MNRPAIADEEGRKLLIHGARSAMPSLLASATPLGTWLRGLVTRVHKNVATVALANKLARIAWAVLRRDEAFRNVSLTAAQIVVGHAIQRVSW